MKQFRRFLITFWTFLIKKYIYTVQCTVFGLIYCSKIGCTVQYTVHVLFRFLALLASLLSKFFSRLNLKFWFFFVASEIVIEVLFSKWGYLGPWTSNQKNKTTLFPSILKVDKIKWSYFFDLWLRGRDTAVVSGDIETNPGPHPFLNRNA